MVKMLLFDADFLVTVVIQMHNADLDLSSVVMVSSSFIIFPICDRVQLLNFNVQLSCFNSAIRCSLPTNVILTLMKIKEIKSTGRKGWII